MKPQYLSLRQQKVVLKIDTATKVSTEPGIITYRIRRLHLCASSFTFASTQNSTLTRELSIVAMLCSGAQSSSLRSFCPRSPILRKMVEVIIMHKLLHEALFAILRGHSETWEEWADSMNHHVEQHALDSLTRGRNYTSLGHRPAP